MMPLTNVIERGKLLNLPELMRKRPSWTDRLPYFHERPSPATRDLVRWYWSYWLPASAGQIYMLWISRRRYQRNIEQIEIDELGDICRLEVDSTENCRAVYDTHERRRIAARFIVATRESRRLRRLAKRWDVDVPPMIVRGEALEPAIAQVRRAIREARWTFAERCAKVLIPILSLLVALAALTLKH